MATTKQSRLEIEIKPHPTYPKTHWLVIVTTPRGRCYFITYAGDKPTEDAVREVWATDRAAFDPYRGYNG